jgi:hypothetical protein
MSFTSSNTVEQMILDATVKLGHKPAIVCEDAPSYEGESLGDALRLACWAIRAKVMGLKEPVTQ